MRCRLGRHRLFPIGWGHSRCKRCGVAFYHKRDGSLLPVSEAQIVR